jgi:hypothetical protein
MEQGKTILMKLVNCSIIIRAYNEEKYIGRLLEGIRQQTIEEYRLHLLVPFYAIPWDTTGLPRVGAAYAPVARDILLCSRENVER